MARRSQRNRHPVLLTLGFAAALMIVAAPRAFAQLNQTRHHDGWILAAAHAPGLEGSIWRTDLWFVFGSSGNGPVTLRFCRSNRDNTDAEEFTFEPAGNGHVYFIEDVVDHFLDVGDGSWVGAIHYTTVKGLQVWARVYSINPEGTESYGQLVEGIPTDNMSLSVPSAPDADLHQWLYAVQHTADDRFRVNIGLVNPTAVGGSFRIDFYDETGKPPPGGSPTVQATVPPYSMVQLSDPLADVMGGEWNQVQIRVVNDTEGSGSFAYASVVDNATNDAFFVRGVKRMKPDE